MKFKKINLTKSHIYGLIYTFFFLLIACVVNYYTYSVESKDIDVIFVFVWTALYAPLFIYHIYDHWGIWEFGFTINYKSLIFLTAFLLLLFFNKNVPLINDWDTVFIQVFARTGEELFFRGFLYALFLKVFKIKKRPWVWAAILSSLLFMIVHTQTFLPEYSTSMIEILKTAIIFSLLRKWSNSILPGLLLHMFAQTADLLGCIFATVFYFVFVLVSYLKKEKLF